MSISASGRCSNSESADRWACARATISLSAGFRPSLEERADDAALAAYFYQSLAAICAAALKLIRIGQEGCQRVLRDATAEAARTVARSRCVARPTRHGSPRCWRSPACATNAHTNASLSHDRCT